DRGRCDGDDTEGASACGDRRDDAHDEAGDSHTRAEDLKSDESGRKALVPVRSIREVVAGRGFGGADGGTEDRRGGQSENRCDERHNQGCLPQSRRLRRIPATLCPDRTIRPDGASLPGCDAIRPGRDTGRPGRDTGRPNRTWRIGCTLVLFEPGTRGGVDQWGVRTRTPRLLCRELIIGRLGVCEVRRGHTSTLSTPR